MSRRVAHMERLRVKTDSYETAGINVKHWYTEYWCGKNERTMEDDGPLTTGEQRAMDKFKESQAIDPWPVCPKCRKAKDRHLALKDTSR